MHLMQMPRIVWPIVCEGGEERVTLCFLASIFLKKTTDKNLRFNLRSGQIIILFSFLSFILFFSYKHMLATEKVTIMGQFPEKRRANCTNAHTDGQGDLWGTDFNGAKWLFFP